MTEPTQLILPGVEEAAEEAPPEAVSQIGGEVVTTDCAFVVYLDDSGHWTANHGLLNQRVATAREPNANDYTHAVADITKDIAAQTAASVTLGLIQQQAMAAQQQMQEQQQARQILQGIGDPKQPFSPSNPFGPRP